MTRIVYIGTSTYSEAQGQRADGIFVYRMDPENGSLEKIQAVESGPEPTFLALHPNRRFLYAVNEAAEGQAAAFAIDPASGRLSYLNRESLGAPGPCYVTLAPQGNWLLTANYSGGSVSVLPVLPDGRLGEKVQVVQHEGSSADAGKAYQVRDAEKVLAKVEHHATGSGVMPDRQEQAHAHSVTFDPSGRFVLVADLGMDRVWVYRFDSETGRIVAHDDLPDSSVATRPGAGPRHLAFHPNGRCMYVSNELDSTVLALTWDASTGTGEAIQTLSTLAEGFQGESWVADIHLTPDGRFLYVSNRGDDSLACFGVEETSGRLSPAGHFSTLGSWPRNFNISPDGKFLLAANQMSDSIAVFKINSSTGSLESSGTIINVPIPMFVMTVDDL
jgi:6-phosphogluconolactonase